MADSILQPDYGVIITPSFGTALNSLATGNSAESDVYNNTDQNFLAGDCELTIVTATSGTVAGFVTLYMYGSFDGTTFPAGADGSAGTFAGQVKNLRRIGTIDDVAGNDATFRTVLPSELAFMMLPKYFGFVVKNSTGQAFKASGHSFRFLPRKIKALGV